MIASFDRLHVRVRYALLAVIYPQAAARGRRYRLRASTDE
jgi:hypothetical protein